MEKICIFAGTTEGRELIEFLSAQPLAVTACVATEYGQTLLPEAENLTVSARRLPVDEIAAMLTAERFALVIDATHPYAASITKSIAKACAATDTEYLRLLRPDSERARDAIYVESAEAAVDVLRGTAGNILLATGSRELAAFSRLPDFSARVYARVLPMDASIAACRDAGVPVRQIIAMQGPFSEEMNLAHLHAAKAKWLVTKDGGKAGGFAEKVSAARRAGARLLVIGRPEQREGLSLHAVMELLSARFSLRISPKSAPECRETSETGHFGAVVTAGLPDAAFLRGEGERGVVPMTKSEVRAVSLAKLQLRRGDVCWDLGAGTGSVAIEMARAAAHGHVYAVECRPEAAALIEQNRTRFGVENLTVVEGYAPEACAQLPAPDAVFIGGSTGNLRQIVALVLEKNPAARIVATAISLETIGELTTLQTAFPFVQTETVSMQIARDKKAGAYHLMTGQNPVYIFTMQGGGTTL